MITPHRSGRTSIKASYNGTDATITVIVDLPVLHIAGAYSLMITWSSACDAMFRGLPAAGRERMWNVVVEERPDPHENVVIHVLSSVGLSSRIIDGEFAGELRGDVLETDYSGLIFDEVQIFGREYSYLLNAQIHAKVESGQLVGTADGTINFEGAGFCRANDHAVKLLKQ
jgi:hypothetical protein